MKATEKSLKEIAEGIGVDKQRVYRFVKRNNITASSEVSQTKQYDEAAQALINAEFNRSVKRSETSGEPLQKSGEATVLEALIRELDIKNQQIDSLIRQNEVLMESLTAAQALHAGTLQQQLPAAAPDLREAPMPATEAAAPPRSRFSFFRKR